MREKAKLSLVKKANDSEISRACNILYRTQVNVSLDNSNVAFVGRASRLNSDFFKNFDLVMQLDTDALANRDYPCDILIVTSPFFSIVDLEILDYKPSILLVDIEAANFPLLLAHLTIVEKEIHVYPFITTHYATTNPYNPCLEWCNMLLSTLKRVNYASIAIESVLNYAVQSLHCECVNIPWTFNGSTTNTPLKWLRNKVNLDKRLTVDKVMHKALKEVI